MMRMRLATLCLPSLVLSVAAENALAEQPSSQEPLDIGSRLELFVDKVLVEEIKGEARLQLQRPTPREVVLVADRPWEGNACGHFSVFKDGGRYRMYYRGLQFATGKTLERPHREVVCYAESLDGIHWYRPDLGLVEFDGSRQNNIILDRLPEVGGRVSNFLVFKDQNPDATPDARYKAVSRGKETGLYVWKSPDGIHWDLLAEAPVVTKGAFDSPNLAFWDPIRREYREYHRGFRRRPGDPESVQERGYGLRDILTGTSQDFVHWTEPVWLRYPALPPRSSTPTGSGPTTGRHTFYWASPPATSSWAGPTPCEPSPNWSTAAFGRQSISATAPHLAKVSLWLAETD